MKSIKPLVADSPDTLLSASRANELISAINALLNMRPGKGIKISKADSGFVVELDDALQEGLALKGDGEGGEGVKDGQAPGALRWRGEYNYLTKDYKANDLVFAKNELLRVGSGLHTVIGHKGLFIATKDASQGDVPGASAESQYYTAASAWTPFLMGYARPPFSAYDPASAYRAGDIVYIAYAENQRIEGAGLWLALYDIEPNTYPIYDSDGVYRGGFASGSAFITSWRRISIDDEVSKQFGTLVRAGTSTNGIEVTATAVSRKEGGVETASLTGGFFSGGTMSGGTVSTDGFNFQNGSNQMTADVTTLPGSTTVQLRLVGYTDDFGVARSRYFLCSDIV